MKSCLPQNGWLLLGVAGTLTLCLAGNAASGEPPHGGAKACSAHTRYLLLNLHPGEATDGQVFARIAALRPAVEQGEVRLGVSSIFSYLNGDRQRLANQLDHFLALAVEHDLPVVVQLDGEQWWNGRPDLWNWWDLELPGFDARNRENVEWSDWGPEHAVRISWRNWGRQIRVRPAPNLMAPRYREACYEEMRWLIPRILAWWRGLPEEKQSLFVGVKVGWESAVGMGSFYYPDGNRYADLPESEDPQTGIDAQQLPHRGVQAIGYAAVSALNLADSGELSEEHLAEVVAVHLADLCRLAHELGLPRDRLFTHSGGWKEGERLYFSAVNEHSCPGWSFYRHAPDPRGDTTAMAAWETSDAPYWAAVEWLPVYVRTREEWETALRNTLSAEGCRYLCIFNWRSIRENADALAAITTVLEQPHGADAVEGMASGTTAE